MTEKSFFEVLEEQMRTEIRAELEREFAAKQQSTKPVDGEIFRADAKAGQFQTWVASHIEKTYFTPSTKKAYGSPTPKSSRHQAKAEPKSEPKSEPKAKASPRPSRELNLEQLVSLELVRRHSGVFIEENFTESELKGAWRKAALKTHPDRFENADQITQARAAALFRELTGAYECLQAVVEATATTSTQTATQAAA